MASVARLGIALVGSYFFGPIGFIAGSLLGNLLFPDNTRTEGPPLGDLNPTSSTYGLPIPRLWGTSRLGVNLMWLDDRIEDIETRVGGKGGPRQTNVRQVRILNMAFGICKGVMDDVTRIWFDNELVFDKTGQGAFKKDGLVFRFYPGDETQLPDAAMEADKGVGQVPAHRGMCYIVFEDYNSEEHGNRVPKVEVEVTSNVALADSVRFSDDITVAEGGLFSGMRAMAVDHKRRLIYTMGEQGTPIGSAPRGIKVYGMDTLQEIRQAAEEDVTVDGSPFNVGSFENAPFHVGADTGYLYAQIDTGGVDEFVKIDPDSLREIQRGDPIPGNGIDDVVEITALRTGPNKHFLLWKDTSFGAFNRFGVMDADDMVTLMPAGDFDDPVVVGLCGGEPRIQLATGWVAVLLNGFGTSPLELYKVEVQATAILLEDGSPFGIETTLADTIPSSTWGSDGVSDAFIGPIFDRSDGGLIFVGTAVGSTAGVFKWREGEGVVWSTTINQSAELGTDGATTIRTDNNVDDGIFIIGNGGSLVSMIDTVTGEILINAADIQTFTGGSAWVMGGHQFMDPVTKSLIGGQLAEDGWIGQVFLDRVTGLGVPLSEIVTDVSEDVGLAASDLDVTELTDTVNMKIARQQTARQAIETLMPAYAFDAVESDYIVKFPKRGQDPLRTILRSDLVPLDEATHVGVSETVREETELPEKLSVSFLDPSTDYQVNTQSTKRVKNPTPAMQSSNMPNVALPISLTATEGRQISERLLFTEWNERYGNKFVMPQEHLDLDPTDVVDVDLEDGNVLRSRLTEASVSADFLVESESRRQDKLTSISTTTSDGALGVPQKLPPGPSATKTILLDVPNLRDVDDTGGVASRLLFAMNGFRSGWRGATLWDSADGATFTNTNAGLYGGTTYGVVTNKLPVTDVPFQTDLDTELRVVLTLGLLSSVTTTEFLNNANVAIVGNQALGNWEIVLFKDAVLQGDGSYLLTTLMRGRRGSDVYANSHNNGDTFIFAESINIGSTLLDLGLLNVGRFYRGVGVGELVEDADIIGLTSTMADLKPYSPSHLDAVVDGGSNIDLSWVRRTRRGGALVDGTDEVPLAEETEAYEVDIKNAPGGTVQRTLSPIIVEAVQYDLADANTDQQAIATILVPGDADADDDSNNAATGTLGTEAVQQTTIKKYGAGSIEFSPTASVDPSQAFLSYPDISAYALGAGDFNTELWGRIKDLTDTEQTFASQWLNTGNQRAWALRRVDGTLEFLYSTDGTSAALVSVTMPVTWATDTHYHLAVARRGTDLFLFAGGVLGTTHYIGTSAIHDSTEVLRLGKLRDSGGDDDPLDGFVDDFRMVVGTAMYTEDFTPPTDALGTRQSVTFEAFQLSAEVGRGFGAEATIAV